MENKSVDVIIPTYHPGASFPELIQRLEGQEVKPDRILVVNTEKEFWNPKWENLSSLMEVHHIAKKDFDHGGTRRFAAGLSRADILVFMTQDALPADEHLIGRLIKPLIENSTTGAAYARQLPAKDCNFIEKYTRSFNYPEESSVKCRKDIEKYGIKTYFCSNVCAAYDRRIYEKLGGFVHRAIFNEDMIYAGNLVKAGYGIAYAANAEVYHSHNYTAIEQFHRNFDLGVSQAKHPEIFDEVPSEGEGLRLVKKTFCYLVKQGRIWLVPKLAVQSGAKYAGYFMGKRYKKLPEKLIRICTMNPSYWEKK